MSENATKNNQDVLTAEQNAMDQHRNSDFDLNPMEISLTYSMFEAVERLTRKDLRAAGQTLVDKEAQFLVSMYYIFQKDRIRCSNQKSQLEKAEEPNLLLSVFSAQFERIEQSIKKALEDYVMTKPIGRWLMSIYGIGPVITAGLISNIDIARSPTAGHIQSFCGYNPNMVWEKGQKRPYAAHMKTLCWHIGQSFMKFSGRDQCYYGKLYLERKKYENDNNEAGKLAAYAAKMLAEKNYDKTKETYKILASGKLPPGQIDARARRWAVKIFLSHLQQIWWELEFKEPAPKPFAVAHLGHAHIIPPTNYTPLKSV